MLYKLFVGAYYYKLYQVKFIIVPNYPLLQTFNIYLLRPLNCDYVTECGFLFDMTISHFIRFITECFYIPLLFVLTEQVYNK